MAETVRAEKDALPVAPVRQARTNNQKGVTIPSQRRFVEYFFKTLSNGTVLHRAGVRDGGGPQERERERERETAPLFKNASLSLSLSLARRERAQADAASCPEPSQSQQVPADWQGVALQDSHTPPRPPLPPHAARRREASSGDSDLPPAPALTHTLTRRRHFFALFCARAQETVCVWQKRGECLRTLLAAETTPGGSFFV